MSAIIEDKPLLRLEEDEFGREPLANMIASSIQNVCSDNHGCIVYGIYGKWGEGKTTLMNFVEDKLKENGKKDNICLSHFNPWLLNNDEALLKEFFSTISSDLGKKLKKKVLKYGNMVSFASKTILNAFIPSVGVALSSFIDNLKNAFDGLDDTVAEQKEKVSSAIASSGKGKHCVVFIDDIDRLDSEELHTVFRLLRQVADFKNTVYIVAMDADIVSKSLGQFFGKGGEEDGRRFIDKIVQVPIVLPAIPDKLLRLSLYKTLSSMLDAFGVVKDRVEKLLEIINPLMKSRRDIIRYVNQLSFTLPAVYDDVCIEDLCVLEAVKARNPVAYNLIREKEHALLRRLTPPAAYIMDNNKVESERKKNYDEAVKDICDCFDDSQKEAVRGALNYMFGNPDNPSLIDGRRIQTNLFFSVYFIQSIPDEIMPNSKINELKSNLFVWPQSDIVEWINDNYKRYGEDKVERTVLGIIRIGDATQLSTRSSILVKALSLSDMAKGYGYNFFEDPNRLSTISNDIMFRYMYIPSLHSGIRAHVEDSKTLCDTLCAVFSDAEFNFCMSIINNDNSPLHTLKVKSAKQCLDILINRFMELSHAMQLKYSKNRLNSLFTDWKRCNRSSFDKYVIGLIEDKSIDYLDILNHFIDGENDAANVESFILFFEAALPQLNQKISEDKRTEANTTSKQLYLSSYSAILQKHGKTVKQNDVNS